MVIIEAHGHESTVHLSHEDKRGDSAIVKYVDRKRTIHHNLTYTIQTNEPPYQEQLDLLNQQDFFNPTDSMPRPDNVSPIDRFQRAAFFSALLPEPNNDREKVSGVLAIARNVSIPFGAPYGGFGVYYTEYRNVLDLENLRYYFKLSTSANVVWLDLNSLDFSSGAPVLTLDPDNIHMSGDVSGEFAPSPAPY